MDSCKGIYKSYKGAHESVAVRALPLALYAALAFEEEGSPKNRTGSDGRASPR